MIKKFIKKQFVYSPFGWWLSTKFFRTQGVTVLMYHRIIQEDNIVFSGLKISDFKEQMYWLKRHCVIINPEDFDKALRGGYGKKPVILITFDDGYHDYYTNAYPILDELQIPAVVFLATSYMDKAELIWTDAISWAIQNTPFSKITGPWKANQNQIIPLNTSSDRNRFITECKNLLKSVPNTYRLVLQQQLFNILGVDPNNSNIQRQMLNWDEVRATMKLTCFGGHTHTHPILSQLDNQSAEDEIRTCRDRIYQETGIMPRYFAYPNGRTIDFTKDTKDILKKYGFDLAFSTIEGVHTLNMDRYAIRRIPTSVNNLADFAWLIAKSQNK
ncbi:MAG: polysaccharide deacetylase family protein [Candidatus Competibacter sp.]|jgi:peptidoglycan/xylan/chitin deacetylase (PgdA/CDA1 family)